MILWQSDEPDLSPGERALRQHRPVPIARSVLGSELNRIGHALSSPILTAIRSAYFRCVMIADWGKRDRAAGRSMLDTARVVIISYLSGLASFGFASTHKASMKGVNRVGR